MSNSGQGFNILETASFLNHFTPKLFGEDWLPKNDTVLFIKVNSVVQVVQLVVSCNHSTFQFTYS
jgi:hypothetical protein